MFTCAPSIPRIAHLTRFLYLNFLCNHLIINLATINKKYQCASPQPMFYDKILNDWGVGGGSCWGEGDNCRISGWMSNGQTQIYQFVAYTQYIVVLFSVVLTMKIKFNMMKMTHWPKIFSQIKNSLVGGTCKYSEFWLALLTPPPPHPPPTQPQRNSFQNFISYFFFIFVSFIFYLYFFPFGSHFHKIARICIERLSYSFIINPSVNGSYRNEDYR